MSSVTTVSREQPGATLVVAGADPAGLSTLSYDAFGHHSQRGIAIEAAAKGSLFVAGARSQVQGGDGMVVVGGVQGAALLVSEGLAGLRGEEDFGLHIAVGEMDIPRNEGDPEVPEVALTTPSSGRVYVLGNAPCDAAVGAPTTCNTPMGPTLSVQTLVSPADSGPQFGESLIFGDFNGDDGEELAIGDPSATPRGKIGARVVAVYTEDQGELRLAASLFDSSLAQDDADLLIVAARGEVFTYFQALIGAGEDAELDIRQ